MIVNEQGKLFGKVSIVDIAVVVCIVLFAAAIGVRFVLPSRMNSNSGKYTYTATVKNIRPESVTAIKNDIGKMWYDEKGNEVGVLKSAEEKPHVADITKNDGTVVLAEMPGKYTMELRFEATALKGTSSVLLGGKREVSNGSSVLANSESIAVTYTISNITKNEK